MAASGYSFPYQKKGWKLLFSEWGRWQMCHVRRGRFMPDSEKYRGKGALQYLPEISAFNQSDRQDAVFVNGSVLSGSCRLSSLWHCFLEEGW